MQNPFDGLEPKLLWNHFDQLRRIPRPSRQEEKAVAYVVEWAAQRKYEVKKDTVGNVCVKVPATPGHENAKTVIVQGHLDMVAEKDKATEFDFMKDVIEVELQGDWLVAPHTTLGADNGMGVAAALASADDPTVVHGPMELLFTIDEETALTGATNLDGAILDGRTMLNLDSEEDGTLFVGCAGGCTTLTAMPLKRVKVPESYRAIRIEVGGLKGGHSGLAIHENRGNSLKILGRVLSGWLGAKPMLETIEGGNKHNAIPREASAIVHLPKEGAEDLVNLTEDVRKRFMTEFGTIDPGLTITLTDAASTQKPADPESTKRLVDLLVAMPHGVIAMSRDIPGLTETSTNLAVAQTTSDDQVMITTSSRSSVAFALRGVLDGINALVGLAGGSSQEVSGYPGWQPNMTSGLLQTCKSTFRDMYGKDPKVTAIDAGLECGIIGEKLGGEVDMISFGPWLEGVHAPGEKVHVPSVGRFWDFYKQLLARLA